MCEYKQYIQPNVTSTPDRSLKSQTATNGFICDYNNVRKRHNKMDISFANGYYFGQPATSQSTPTPIKKQKLGTDLNRYDSLIIEEVEKLKAITVASKCPTYNKMLLPQVTEETRAQLSEFRQIRLDYVRKKNRSRHVHIAAIVHHLVAKQLSFLNEEPLSEDYKPKHCMTISGGQEVLLWNKDLDSNRTIPALVIRPHILYLNYKSKKAFLMHVIILEWDNRFLNKIYKEVLTKFQPHAEKVKTDYKLAVTIYPLIWSTGSRQLVGFPKFIEESSITSEHKRLFKKAAIAIQEPK